MNVLMLKLTEEAVNAKVFLLQILVQYLHEKQMLKGNLYTSPGDQNIIAFDMERLTLHLWEMKATNNTV